MASRYETLAKQIQNHVDQWGETGGDYEVLINILEVIEEMPGDATGTDLAREIGDLIEASYVPDAEGFFAKRQAEYERKQSEKQAAK